RRSGRGERAALRPAHARRIRSFVLLHRDVHRRAPAASRAGPRRVHGNVTTRRAAGLRSRTRSREDLGQATVEVVDRARVVERGVGGHRRIEGGHHAFDRARFERLLPPGREACSANIVVGGDEHEAGVWEPSREAVAVHLLEHRLGDDELRVALREHGDVREQEPDEAIAHLRTHRLGALDCEAHVDGEIVVAVVHVESMGGESTCGERLARTRQTEHHPETTRTAHGEMLHEERFAAVSRRASVRRSAGQRAITRRDRLGYARAMYTLRSAESGDFEALFTLYREGRQRSMERALGAWDGVDARRAFAELFRAFDLQVVEHEGAPIGAMAVDWDDDPVALVSLDVVPALRGRGWGTRLVGDLIRQARRRNRDVEVRLRRADPARRLFTRLGFERVDEDATHFVLRWSATPEARGALRAASRPWDDL